MTEAEKIALSEPLAEIFMSMEDDLLRAIANTKNPLNYGHLSPQNRIYQSFCGDFFSIILMAFIISR